jgi:hypothetical protein
MSKRADPVSGRNVYQDPDAAPEMAMTAVRRIVRRPRLRDVVVVCAVALVTVEVVAGRGYLARSVRTLGHVHLGWVALAVIASVASMAYFARTQRRMLRAAGTNVPIRKMLRLVFEANAINITLPGGTAFSFVYASTRLRGFGATSAATGFALLASGLLSSVTFWALALTYVVLVGGHGGWLAPLVIAVVLAAIFAVARRRPGRLSRRIQVVLTRTAMLLDRRWPRAGHALRSFAEGLLAVRPRRTDWAIATVFAELNWLADLLCLAACCLAVADAHTSPVVLLAAYLAGMTASSLSLLPGGFGVIEVAMIFALTAGGTPATTAAPAVLLYRLISCVLVVTAGWVAWFVTSVVKSGDRAAPAPAAVRTSARSPRSACSPTSSHTAIRSRSSMTRTASPTTTSPPSRAGRI